MSKKIIHNTLFKIGLSSALLSTTCNIIPVSAINQDINSSSKKLESYLYSNESLTKLEKQNDILKKIENLKSEKSGYIKNYNELKILTSNNICLDANSLNELEHVKNLSELYSKNLTVNLFDENNLDTALKNILSIIISNNIEGTSFSSKFDKINSNNEIKKELILLSEYLNINTNSSNDKQIFILRKLNEIEFLLNNNSIKENSINTFFNAMKKAYQMLVSKRISSLLIESEREKAINYLQGAAKNRTLSTSGEIGYNGFTTGITTKVHHNEGKAEKSFYEISIGGGLSLAIGYELGLGIEDLKAALGITAEISGDISASTVFFSLEQFLDAQINPNIKDKSSSYLTSNTIKKLVADRKNLIESEKKLISCFKNSIEFYLKAANIVPASVNMTWPTLSKAPAPTNVSQKAFSGNTKVIADLLGSSLGSSVTVSGKKINQKINNSYIKIINDDCTTNLGLSPDEIVKEFSEKDSICFKIKKDFEKSLLADTLKNKDQKILPFLTSIVLADIRQYNSVLSILADENSDTTSINKAKETKKEIEKRWIGKNGIIKTTNREKFFKTAIALSVYLRQFTDIDEEIFLFKQIYNELLHLSEIQSLSKNSKSYYNGFKTKKSYKEYSISGSNSVNVFDIANASINVKYLKIEDEPGYGDGNNIIISINLPFIDTALAGIDLVKNKLHKMHTNTPKNEFKIEEAFLTTSKFLDTAVGFTGFPVALKVPGASASANGYLNLTFELTKINKSETPETITPIDEYEKILNNKNSWVLKCIKTSAVSNLNAKLSGNVNAETVKVAGEIAVNDEYIKGTKFKLGTKCLEFPISRFNVSSICSKDTNIESNKNYLWTSFKTANKNELYKLFLNIAKIHNIAYYQVQSMYNNILLETSGNDKQNLNDIFKNAFKDFIESCKILKSLEKYDETAYNNTLNLFEKVLDLNFKYNFQKKLNKNWSIDSKKQNITINY